MFQYVSMTFVIPRWEIHDRQEWLERLEREPETICINLSTVASTPNNTTCINLYLSFPGQVVTIVTES